MAKCVKCGRETGGELIRPVPGGIESVPVCPWCIGEAEKSLEVPVKISREDRGVNFDNTAELRWPPIKAVISINEQRISLTGTFSITRPKNAWKFGPEIQIQIYTSEAPLIEPRAKNNGWNRVEFFLPFDSDTIKFLKERILELEKEKEPGVGSPPAGGLT